MFSFCLTVASLSDFLQTSTAERKLLHISDSWDSVGLQSSESMFLKHGAIILSGSDHIVAHPFQTC